MKPAFCATCIEERDDLVRAVADNGRAVWLCPPCRGPLGVLREHHRTTEPGIEHAAKGYGRTRMPIGRAR